MIEDTKRNRRQILSGNEKVRLPEVNSQAGQLICSGTPAVLGKTSRMTDSLENLIKVRRYDAAFCESSRLFLDTGDILYLSTCLHIFSLGTEINGDELLTLIDKCTGPIHKDYSLGVYYAIQARWSESFLKFRAAYLACQKLPPESPLCQKQPLCLDFIGNNGVASFFLAKIDPYLAALFNACSIPEALIEKELGQEELLRHRLHVFGTNLILNRITSAAVQNWRSGELSLINEQGALNRLQQLPNISLWPPDASFQGKKASAKKELEKFPTPQGTTWEDVFIFIQPASEGAYIRIRGRSRTVHYTKIGFKKGKGKANGSDWNAFVDLIAVNANPESIKRMSVKPKRLRRKETDDNAHDPLDDLTEQDKQNGQNAKTRQAVQSSFKSSISHIRQILKEYIGIEGDPFYRFEEKGFYVPRFHSKMSQPKPDGRSEWTSYE